jgi:hypothetical protein
MVPLPALEVAASERALHARRTLDPTQTRKLEWWLARLKADAFAGDQIPKDRIPAALATRNGLAAPLSNAWRFELPGAWRGVYTVKRVAGRKPTVIILELLSHADYDGLFGYR